MKAVITGGAGFIGSNLCDYLIKKKFKIIVIDNLETGNIKNLKKIKNKIKFIKADITKTSSLKDSYFKNVDILVDAYRPGKIMSIVLKAEK